MVSETISMCSRSTLGPLVSHDRKVGSQQVDEGHSDTLVAPLLREITS